MKLFDLHCDTLCACQEQGQGLTGNNLHISLEQSPAHQGWVQTFAMWIDDQYRGEAAWSQCQSLYQIYCEEKNRLEGQLAVYTGKAPKPNVCESILSVEGGAAIGGKLERLETLHQMGVRFFTMTWNGDNELASGVRGSGRGLTPLGQQAVKELERLSIVVDVSHLNEEGFWQLEKIAARPFIATHSNAYAICPHPRNLTDDQVRCIAERGGLIGLNFFPLFVSGGDDYPVETLIRHAEHFLELGAEHCLALGSDFDGAGMPSFLPGIKGLANLYESMIKYFHDDLTERIFFGNAEDFYRRTWKTDSAESGVL